MKASKSELAGTDRPDLKNHNEKNAQLDAYRPGTNHQSGGLKSPITKIA